MEEINLKELFNYFMSKISILIIVLLLVIILGNIYSLFIKTPLYQSTTKLVLVSESNNKVSAPYDRIWVLNIAFLQLAIIKNATFVLVTPTRQYYDYEKHNAIILPGETRPRFYSRELKYIHDAGYKWKNFDVKLEQARKG